MKVLHLNTYTYNKSLSFPHYQFHKILLKNGHESFIISAKGDVKENEIIYLNEKRVFPYFDISRFVRKLYFEKYKKNRNNYFFPEWNLDFVTTKQILKKIKIKPDIIMVYWTKFAFNQKIIYELSTFFSIPVICVMVDMAPMTGGCHYAFDCERYFERCGKCPALNSNKDDDLSRKTWEFKKKYLDMTDLTVLAASDILSKQVSKSSLLCDKKIEKFLNSVNEQIFVPQDKFLIRDKMNLPCDRKIVFFGAASIKEKRKGFSYFKKALEILYKNLEKDKLKDNIFLLIVGNNFDKCKLPFEYKYYSYLRTEADLSKMYQACDLFVCPSIEDSGPLMINQSILSGRPVVSFDMGVARDLVYNGKTGYIAELKNSSDLAFGIQSILSMSEIEWNCYSMNCRKLGMKKCSTSSQNERLESLLNQVIKNFKDKRYSK